MAWHEGLAWEDRPLPSRVRCWTSRRARFPPQGDYASEINPAAEALVETLARTDDRAARSCIIDYGFPQHEYYHPAAQRAAP